MLWLLVSLCLLQLTPPQAPARDVAPSTPGTGAISGRITDQESRQPIPGATVVLHSGKDVRTATTDADGRYSFSGLSAGSYVLMADGGYERATHLTHVYGDPRPVEAAMGARSKSFALADGEAQRDVDISLIRASAIDGRVLDPDGEPMARVEVTAEGLDPSLWKPATARTDDRGVFRLFGLAPGPYRVCVNPRFDEWGYAALADRLDRPVRTCYPDAVNEADGAAVEAGPRATPAIEIAVQRRGAFTVTGVIVDASGAPAPTATVTLLPPGMSGRVAHGRIDRSGRFAIAGVTPGRYMLAAGMASRTELPPGEAVGGYLPITVDNANVEGLVVPIARGARVGGHVTFRDRPAPSAASLRMTVGSMPESRAFEPALGRMPSARVTAALTFELADVFLPLALAVQGLPAGWAVDAIKYRGADITGVATAFVNDTDPRLLEIVLTDRAAELAGTVLDDQDTPASGACVLAFPADAKRPLSRASVMFAMATEKGEYRLQALKFGTYAVVALPFGECLRAELGLPALDTLGRAREPVTLSEKPLRRLDLRLSTLTGRDR